LFTCAVQSLQRLSRARQHVLSSNFERQGCRLGGYTGSIERTVVTRTVCAEGSLVLVSEVGSIGDKNQAALGTHGTCGHCSFYRAGVSPQSTALTLKI